MFVNLNVSEKSILFTDIFLDIMAKHISNKIITCDDKDAPWVTPAIKTATRRNSKVYRKWVNRGKNPLDRNNVREVEHVTNKLTKGAELGHFTNLGAKLSDPKIGQNNFWTAYKRIVKKTKIPIFHPLLIMAYIFLIVSKKLIYLMNIFVNICCLVTFCIFSTIVFCM